MDYSPVHAKALQKVQDKGAPAVFYLRDPGDYDPDQDKYPDPSETGTVEGSAVELPGDPEEYAAMDLIPTAVLTLFFVPDTFGEAPPLSAVILWAGAKRTVRAIIPIRPAGELIAARVIVE